MKKEYYWKFTSNIVDGNYYFLETKDHAIQYELYPLHPEIKGWELIITFLTSSNYLSKTGSWDELTQLAEAHFILFSSRTEKEKNENEPLKFSKIKIYLSQFISLSGSPSLKECINYVLNQMKINNEERAIFEFNHVGFLIEPGVTAEMIEREYYQK